MAGLLFLDTNVLVRHITQDDPLNTPKASAFLAEVQRGEVEVSIADTVVFEAVFTLEKHYKFTRPDIRDTVLPIVELPGVYLPAKASLRDVFDLYVNHPALSFADCYHVVLVQRLNLPGIVSFDQGLDQVPGLNRVEPT